MQANDWERAADMFADGFAVDWPCSGERISRREDFVAIQSRYPAAGKWRFDIHRLIVDGGLGVTEFTASDGEQSARAVAFSEVEDGRIARQVEYWAAPYEPPAWRAALVERIDRIP
jgi:hypothetical protein